MRKLNTKNPFLSASTQISAAAVIYKYYKEIKVFSKKTS